MQTIMQVNPYSWNPGTAAANNKKTNYHRYYIIPIYITSLYCCWLWIPNNHERHRMSNRQYLDQQRAGHGKGITVSPIIQFPTPSGELLLDIAFLIAREQPYCRTPVCS